MKYSELIQFEPIDSAVQLRQADGLNEARRLVMTYAISEEMAGRLTRIVFSHLRFDHTCDNRGLLLVGSCGSGKSHLMSVVSSVAERADLAKHLAHREVAQAAVPIAGKFKVLRTELGGTRMGFCEFVCAQLEQGLANWGVKYSFPAQDLGPPHCAGLEEMMAAFHRHLPNHGLLLLADELLEYLCDRDGQALVRDLAFLGEIGEVCRSSRLRFIAGLREALPDNPAFARVSDSVRRLQDRFAQVPVPSNDVRLIMANRVLKKTAEQQAKIRDQLRPFAKFYGHMNARLDDFVALFPVHPDYLEVIGHLTFAQKREVLRTLSDTVKSLLNDDVPQDRPGLIAYDNYWEHVCGSAVLRSATEVQAVLDCSEPLENTIAHSFTPPEHKDMALRIIHALAVHRLTTGDLYTRQGATPAELRDMLCLSQCGSEDTEGNPAGHLLSQVKAVLHEVQQTAGGQILSSHPDNGQYFLRLRKFKRFVGPELLLHWVNAVPFLLLLLTGGALLVSRFCHLDSRLSLFMVPIHKAAAASWALFLPLTVLMRLKVHWSHLRTMLSWGPDDAVWIVQSLRSLHNAKAPVLPAGRFNTGQKINACLVMLYFVGFGASGLLMLWQGTILFPWYIHAALFFAALGSVGGHLYLALVNPSTRIALPGIFHGWAPLKYVEHHHPLSLPRSLHPPTVPSRATTLREELLVARLDLVMLAVPLIITGVDVVAFNQWQLTSIKKHFAKSFSDCITPRELSTKHRIGQTVDSCTKCHSYTGAIPDEKCETCHSYVKERRERARGYHGTLTGECTRCHKEHPSQSQALVPLLRDTFDHNLASFARTGKHLPLACDDCHKNKRSPGMPGVYYMGLAYGSCTDCHRDPHAGQLTGACEKCHSPNGWTGTALTFVHNTDSAYALAGQHNTVACIKCHKPPSRDGSLGTALFKGLPGTCSGCHDDPHRKQFAGDCTACHSTAGWKKEQLSFDHNKTSQFPLLGKHAVVACEKCHTAVAPGAHLGFARFRGLPSACADCHPDPHRGQLERACTKCHPTPASWAVNGQQFEHGRDTRYALRGKHSSVQCIKCHTPRGAGGSLATAQFKGLETGCETCHKVEHPKPYGKSCTSCHHYDYWPPKKAGFDHIFKVEIEGDNLGGKHLTAECSACHDGVRIGAVGQSPTVKYECSTCHRAEDPHQGGLGERCVKCHTSDGWKGSDLRFDHDTMASYALDQDHRKVACAKCHEKGRWKPVNAGCENCHTKGFLDKRK
jgi:cytochrome b subunit of formate dehydrogenase